MGKNTDPIKEIHIKKGTALISQLPTTKKGVNPYHDLCSKFFEAKIQIKYHHTTIQKGYQCVMHVGGIRQTVEFVSLKDKETMRVGDAGHVLLRFKYGVQMLDTEQKIVLRELSTMATGYICKVYSMNEPADQIVENFISNQGT